ncbi:hypothetical protein H920_06046 [Fukomys damarensis]|uniref:Uncharacterized protein n=1 Tax=Fukomys damarensis TaxID=885580 RepID=A0A091DQD7_FUKDA|nr:hypothetical protein H920_06046 [Fukomys damarensis]
MAACLCQPPDDPACTSAKAQGQYHKGKAYELQPTPWLELDDILSLPWTLIFERTWFAQGLPGPSLAASPVDPAPSFTSSTHPVDLIQPRVYTLLLIAFARALTILFHHPSPPSRYSYSTFITSHITTDKVITFIAAHATFTAPQTINTIPCNTPEPSPPLSSYHLCPQRNSHTTPPYHRWY